MKLKFKQSCVFHGDRTAGEIVDFAALPPDARIVIGAGLAEILTEDAEPETHEPPEMPREALEGADADDGPAEETTAEKAPAKRAKRKRK